MPLYGYRCQCGCIFDRIVPLARYDEPQLCSCGKVAEKQLSAPAIRGDYAGYTCPITGNWIEGRRQHEENLARHGCRVLEPGETQQARASAARAEEALLESVAETAAATVESLPAAKREQLGRELSNGADITVERR